MLWNLLDSDLMAPELMKQILLSPLGFFLGVLLKSFLAALFWGIAFRLFRYKGLPLLPFKMKYVLACFLILVGLRMAILAVFSSFGGVP